MCYNWLEHGHTMSDTDCSGWQRHKRPQRALTGLLLHTYTVHKHCTYAQTVRMYILAYTTLRTVCTRKRTVAEYSCHVHTYVCTLTVKGHLRDIVQHTDTYVTYHTIYTPKPTYCIDVCTDIRPAHRRCTMRHAVQRCTYCALCVHQDSP